MLPTLALPVTFRIPLTELILPKVPLAVMTEFVAPILPTLALPVTDIAFETLILFAVMLPLV